VLGSTRKRSGEVEEVTPRSMEVSAWRVDGRETGLGGEGRPRSSCEPLPAWEGATGWGKRVGEDPHHAAKLRCRLMSMGKQRCGRTTTAAALSRACSAALRERGARSGSWKREKQGLGVALYRGKKGGEEPAEETPAHGGRP